MHSNSPLSERLRRPRLARLVLAPLALLAGLAAPVEAQDIKGSVDGSLRWLRKEQREDGTWNGNLEDTALVLHAFATSHRKYTVWDGPFLKRGVDALVARRDAKTGAIGTPRETLLSALALQSLQADVGSLVLDSAWNSAAKALGAQLPEERTIAALSAFCRTALGENLPPAEPSADAAGALAQQLLADRGQEGGFAGGVRPTALGVLLLSRCAEASARAKSSGGSSAPVDVALPAPVADYDLARLRANAARFLLASENRVDGMWGFASFPDLGITAMVLGALQAIPADQRDEELRAEIAKGLQKLAAAQKEDGSIHNGQVIAYTTSVALLALAADGGYAEQVAKARAFLTRLQADEGEGYGEDHKFYGGIGYGGDERPDLSNLQMALDAIVAGGANADDEAVKKALVFLNRVQNRSESNTGEVRNEAGTFVAGNDGGGLYAPGESAAGTDTLPDGRKTARSYGSMTYAMLKGFLYAGLPKDDPRVRAAYDWIRANYTVDRNPGFERLGDPKASMSGYYYYLHTMARTLDLYGQERIADGTNHLHEWRREIAARLASLQREDGSWVNQQAERWWEGNPVLATSYALLALHYAR